MARLLYRLEDHFDGLARECHGHFSGWLSRVARALCAWAGDCLRPLRI